MFGMMMPLALGSGWWHYEIILIIYSAITTTYMYKKWTYKNNNGNQLVHEMQAHFF